MNRVSTAALLLVAVLWLGSIPAHTAPAGSGEGSSSAGSIVFDGRTWTAQPLSSPISVTFNDDVHRKVVEAAQDGQAYNVILDRPVDVQEGDIVVEPGGPLIGWANGGWQKCTMGFLLGSPGDYHVSTAGHCVHLGGQPVTHLRGRPDILAKIGDVTHDPDAAGEDWAAIELHRNWTDNVNPVVPGSTGPVGPAYDGSTSAAPPTDLGDATGEVQPAPVYMVAQERGNVTNDTRLVLGFVDKYAGTELQGEWVNDTDEARRTWRSHTGDVELLFFPEMLDRKIPRHGVLVEKHEGFYLCECASVDGNSGGPVLVFTPEHPRGQALGLIQSGLRPVWHTPLVDDLPGQRDVDEGNVSTYIQEVPGRLAGSHELTAISQISTVVSEVGKPVATASDLPGLPEEVLGCTRYEVQSDPLCLVPGKPEVLDCDTQAPFPYPCPVEELSSGDNAPAPLDGFAEQLLPLVPVGPSSPLPEEGPP